MALLNPLLAYFLVKRISGPVAGLIAAALVTLLGYNAKTTLAINLDAALLTFYLLSLLALLAAASRDNPLLALLSGVLLGASILTKETAFVNLPLALLAVLLLDWNLRGALWHYLGVVLVCLPWWIWAYSATAEVYLVERLPVPFQVPVMVAAAIFLVFATVAYASGLISRLLADERRRRWSGWFVALSWTVSLSGLLLATASHALGKVSFEDLRLYLAQLLAPIIVVVPTLLMAVGYAAWKALRRDGAWRLFALALLFQVPICLLVAVERWAPRQYLILQMLVFCALAALVVDAGEAALRARSYSSRLRGAVVAAPLTILLLTASVERVQALLPQSHVGGLSGQHRAASPETEMIDWMAQNVPEGEHILYVSETSINAAQAKYLKFLDGGRHEWTRLYLDQGICKPRPNIQIRCDPEKNAISRIPPEALWVQIVGRCKVISLSMPNVLRQVRQSDSDYVMIAGGPEFPSILQLPATLQKSNAFEVFHTEFNQTEESGANQGVVLLNSTGQVPKALLTQMNANTRLSLKHCEEAKVQGTRGG